MNIDMNNELTDIYYKMRPLKEVLREFRSKFHGFNVLSPTMKKRLYRKVSQYWHKEQEDIESRTATLRKENGIAS
jgi:hypothetical protein